MNSKRYYSDFLVIGSGIAGLTFAIKASNFGTVHIVTKKREQDSSTNYAQGGIASVLSPEDSFDKHIEDTLIAGAGLCNKKAVEVLVKNGPQLLKELMDWGTVFSTVAGKDGKKVLDLGREGGHSCNRIAHAKDLTGQEIEKALLNKIASISNITMFEDHTAIDLLTEHQLRFLSAEKDMLNGEGTITCYGAYVLDNESGIVDIYNARVTFLASGGVGQVYLHTTNPSIATGDGIAMAYRAGALIADMEFIQFHPTSLYQKEHEGRSFLISEAVRGEGAILLNSKGERFMEGAHPLKELAPRDIVARAIDKELKRLGDKFVLLDITFKDKAFLKNRFPGIYKHCKKLGIDITKDPIPVVPAAHYLCGGIISDLNGRTSIQNLFASGEASCTGVHGANRLASNSLLEGLVFSHRTTEKLSELMEKLKDKNIPAFPDWSKEGTYDLEGWILIRHNIDDIKRLMWDYVGIVRSNLRLERAYRRILLLAEEIQQFYEKSTISHELVELRNLATVSKLIIKSAVNRKESRGLHYNTDYPDSLDEQKNSVILHSGLETYRQNIGDMKL